MGKVPAAHTAGGPHRATLGQLDSRNALHIEQLPENLLLGVIRAGGITGSRADPAISFANQILVAQVFIVPVTEILAGLFVETFGKCFRQPIRNRFSQDRTVIVMST